MSDTPAGSPTGSTTADADRSRPPGGVGKPRTLLSVRGVPVRADVSLLLAVALFTYVYFLQYRELLSQTGTVTVLAVALVSALLLEVSVLCHEIGHALVSVSRGIPVRSITLFALGGVTESTREAARARDEFAIVGVGPFVSLVLAALFGLVYTAVMPLQIPAAISGYLAWTNLLLAIFNVVPGYPLDGGRLLRSLLWAVTGRPHRATRWAARVGQVFALLLIGFSIAPFFGLPGFGSLFNIFIGVFLLRGASEAHQQARLRERLQARTAAHLMGSVPPTLPPSTTVGDAVDLVASRPSLLWPVGEPVVGAVSLARLDRVPSSAWSSTTVGEIAFPSEQVTIAASAAMEEVLERMTTSPESMLVVVEDGRAVGLLTPSLVTGDAS